LKINQERGFNTPVLVCTHEVSPMTDPLDKATSQAPATLGEGCLSRYDPDELSPDDGTDFPDAAQLWEQLQQEPQTPSRPKPA